MGDSRFRGQRMAKHWHFIGPVLLPFTGSATIGGAALALDGPWTVIRMLGEYLITFLPGGTIVAGDNAAIAVAIGVVSSDAFAAGSASLPDPLGEPEYPWLYWAHHTFSAIEATPEQNTTDVGSLRRSFDIRSMRKLKPRESLFTVAQYADGSGAPPMNVHIDTTRVLVAT